MVVISELARIRADGRVIDARMTLDRMIGLGWEPSKVIEVCWRWEGELLRLANHLGLLVMVAPDRQHLAVLWNHDAEGLDATLYVVAGDKRKFTRVPGELMINGNAEAVTYLWFEHPAHASPGTFICICSRRRDHANYRVDIDAVTASVLSVRPCR
ncbi:MULTISPECIES: hypothetical protein [Stenotrophomonas]|jgi:hypothetical protein|uniref:hypothetical protein n=1 Tax=Stenotrophomonas TaxID=40323 RepID=UPI0003734EC6|nr:MULTISPECIES: hypothetical protein [Stenotrophomonas]